MTPENFCYWLQGYFELSSSAELSEKQRQQIKDHLSLVFHKLTPPASQSGVMRPGTFTGQGGVAPAPQGFQSLLEAYRSGGALPAVTC